jgi:pyrophosphatase PpaX
MKAVLWDLDDTVLDTLPARMRSLQHAYETCLGETVDPLEVWKAHRGGTLEALARRLLGDGHQRFSETYREHYYGQPNRCVTYDGIDAVLRTLRDEGIVLGVVTSKISWGAVEELEIAGLLHHFRVVIGHDDVERPKPEPDPIYEAMSRLLIDDAGSVMFVGDSPADMLAAHAAGCHSVAALWGTIDRESLIACGPASLAEEPPAVLEALAHARRRKGPGRWD